jgi:hypothetical protein
MFFNSSFFFIFFVYDHQFIFYFYFFILCWLEIEFDNFFHIFLLLFKKKTHQSNGLDLDFTKKKKNQFSCLGKIKNDGIKIESKVK